MQIVSSLIGGRSYLTTDLAPITDPATGTVIRQVSLADSGVIDAAIAAATAAFPAWRATPPAARARILMKFRDLIDRERQTLATLICEEHGKPVADALGSIQRGIEVVEFAMGAPHLLKGESSDAVSPGISTRSSRQPVGVCVGITPFNYPAMIPLWMIPMALACGNSFILKPSEKTPSAANFMADLWTAAGLPDGVLSVVHGGAAAAQMLITHPGVAAVSFVGSSAIAARVYAEAAASGKRVQALGGAKNHAIVLADADMKAALAGLLNGAFNSAGQRCMAISVAIVVEPLGDAFVDRLLEETRALVTGPGGDSATFTPPLTTADARDRVADLVSTAPDEGAHLLLDGRSPRTDPLYERGYFVAPTIIDRVTPAMRIYREEVFGPVLCIMRAGSLDEAIALSNAHPLANGAVLFSASGEAAARFERDIACGMPGINVPVPSPVAFHSFGGWSGSMFGDLAVHGTDAISFYTRRRTITTRWP